MIDTERGYQMTALCSIFKMLVSYSLANNPKRSAK
jgi:hypothetical protein